MTVESQDRSLLLYGGFNLDTLSHHIWLYNLYANRWFKVNFANITHGLDKESALTPGNYKGDTMVRSASGVFVTYGGATWQ